MMSDAKLVNLKFMSLSTITLLAAGTLLSGCREQPSLGGRGDTVETPTGSTAAGELAYVTNEDSQELSVIDTRSDSVVATIPVGTRPRGVRVSKDGKTVYVALSGSPKCPPTMSDEECEKLKADKSKDGIAVVDVAARRVTRVLPGGSDPETFDISRDGSTLFVSNEDAGTASIVDIASGKIRSTVKVGKEPEGVRLQPDPQRDSAGHQDRQGDWPGRGGEAPAGPGIHARRCAGLRQL
jgi:YVTN family beta-propeller protein